MFNFQSKTILAIMSSSEDDESERGRVHVLLNQLTTMCQGLMDSTSAIETSIPKILTEKGAN